MKIFLIALMISFGGYSIAATGSTLAVQPNSKTENEDSKIMNQIVELVLNQITRVGFEFDIEFSGQNQTVNGKPVSSFDLSNLLSNGIVQFKDNIEYEFPGSKADAQLSKVIPKIVLVTKGITMVVNLEKKQKWNLRVRFCQNYTGGNDFCDTASGKKYLNIQALSESFTSIQQIVLKEINVTFDQNKNNDFVFKGTCDALKNTFEIETAQSVLKPAVCEFNGEYSPEDNNKINYHFKFKRRTQ